MKSFDVYNYVKINDLYFVKDYKEKVDKWETWKTFAIILLLRDHNIQEIEEIIIPTIRGEKTDSPCRSKKYCNFSANFQYLVKLNT